MGIISSIQRIQTDSRDDIASSLHNSTGTGGTNNLGYSPTL